MKGLNVFCLSCFLIVIIYRNEVKALENNSDASSNRKKINNTNDKNAYSQIEEKKDNQYYNKGAKNK